MQTREGWLRAHEARRMLGGSSCELMHLREDGKLHFQKRGNAFLYAEEDVRREAILRKALITGGRRKDESQI